MIFVQVNVFTKNFLRHLQDVLWTAIGTWWTGTYGLGLSVKTNDLNIEIGPFVGFRYSTSNGRKWSEPAAPDGAAINVSRNVFGEQAAGAPDRRSKGQARHQVRLVARR